MTPRAGRIMHIGFMIFWGLQMIAVAIIMFPWTWKSYLVEISLAALFITNLAGWSAERPTEVAETR